MFVLPVPLGWKIAVFFLFLLLPAVISAVHPPVLDVTVPNGVASFSFTSQKVADKLGGLNKTW